MKGLWKCAALCCAAALSVGAFAACGTGDNKGGGAPGNASAFVALDINPSVEMTVDANGKVVSVRAANKDAEVLLVGVELKGLSVKEAAEKIVQLATQMGYLNENNTDVKIITATESGSLEESVNAEATEGAKQANDTVTIFTESTKSLAREVKKLQEVNAELYKDLTPAKLRLIKAAQRYQKQLTVEQGAAMKVAELMAIVKNAHDDYEELLTEDLEERYKQLEEEKTADIQARIDALYGEEYAALKAVENALENKLEQIEDARERQDNVEFTAEQIAELAQAAGIADVSALAGEDGKTTFKSVSRYYEELEAKYDEIEDEAEDDAVEEQLDAIEDWLEQFETEFDEDSYVFTDAERAEIAAIVGENAPEITSYAQAEEYAEQLEEQLETMEEEIEAAMTKEVREQIKALEKEKDAVEREVKREMKTAIKQAEEELKQLKNKKLAGGGKAAA